MFIVTVVIVGVALAAVVLLASFRLRASRSVWAKLTPEGIQEARIVINGGYHPDRIRVVPGTPLRLHFLRQEDNPCSERVVFSGVGVERRLPPFQETVVQFVPNAPGTFLFTCQWGVYRGKLMVASGKAHRPMKHPRMTE